MANAAAEPKKTKPGSVVIFSLEMSSEQLATRLLSEESRVSGERIRKGEIGEREFSRFVSVSKELQSTARYTSTTRRPFRCPPCAHAAAACTRTRGLSLIVIDYLQLMRPSPGTRAESRVLEISAPSPWA